MDGHQDCRATQQAPEKSISVASTGSLDAEKSGPLECPGVHEDGACGESVAGGLNTKSLSNMGHISTDVDGASHLLVLADLNPVKDHEEHQVWPL